MKRIAGFVLLICTAATLLGYQQWSRSSQIKPYSSDDLIDLTCMELSDTHEEVLSAYHDAEIAYKRRTGAFHDDLGLPQEEALPVIVLMKRIMQDHQITLGDLRYLSAPATSLQRSDFYYEISSTCASTPEAKAADVMRQVARNLDLMG